MRCFIAIMLPKDVRREIYEIQKKLPDFSGKKTEIENIHLTLKFLGEIDEFQRQKITNLLRIIQFKKFYAEIGSMGVFSDKNPRIIWLHMKNTENLQKEIDEKLSGFFKKEERFMGHVTIARIKGIKNKKSFLKELNKLKIEKMKFEVNEFLLMESELFPEGSRYKVLESFKLN